MSMTKTIRLIYPQWQGGQISRWIQEISDPELAARGYYLGSMLLDFLAPATNMEKYTVPVSLNPHERTVTDGVLDRDIIAEQTQAALDILKVVNPDKIVTLGGECSVSVVPFTWLMRRYDGDVAMIWIDAHPDITLPGDVYPGYHAMAVAATMGLGDKKILAKLPAKFSADKILLVGLRDWERDEIKARQEELGLSYLSPEDVAKDSSKLSEWLQSCGASKVVIHLDLDVLDPAEIILAVGVSPEGMKLAEVVRVINDIAAQKDLVGITIAEAMPRKDIILQNMLAKLPLIQ